MKRLRAARADLMILAGFWLLPLLLYGSVTLGGQTMLPVDNLFQWQPWAGAAAELGVGPPQNGLLTDLVIQNYPWKRFFVESVRQGTVPLWNPYLFAGTPFLATGQHSLLYPFSWLFLLLPIPAAYGWYTVSQLWLAGVLMYVLGRVLGMRRGSAAVAGLVYQGSGFLLTSAAVFPMILGAAVWLPLLLACIERIVRPGGPRFSATRQLSSPALPSTVLWAGLGSVALGLQILAGHVEITYYTLLVMGVYALWRLAGVGRRTGWRGVVTPAGWLLAMVLLGVLLGAVQLAPFYEVGRLNFRSGETTLAQVRGYAFPWRRLVTFLLPDFFGNPTHRQVIDVFNGRVVSLAGTSEWGIKNYVEGGVYAGVLTLLLAALAVWSALRGGRAQPDTGGQTEPVDRRAQTSFFAGISLLALAFIFGTPLYALVYYGLPFADQIRTPFRWTFPLTLFLAVLAGFGLDTLTHWRPAATADIGPPGRRRAAGYLAATAFWGGLALLAGLLGSRLAYSGVAPLVERLFHGLALADRAFPDARTFYSYTFWQLALLGGMLMASGAMLWWGRRWAGRRRGGRAAAGLALTLLLLDLVLAHRGFHAAANPALLAVRPALISWLAQQPGPWRLTSFAPAGDKPLNANTAWLYDYEDVRGYDSIIPRQYVAYMTAIEPQQELQFNRIQPIVNWEALNSPLLDVLNVKYIITATAIDLPKLRLAWTDGTLRVYENLAVAPRAYTLPATSTVLARDPLAALTQFDPRHHVVVPAVDLPPAAGPPPASPSPATLAPAAIDRYEAIEVVVTASVAEPAWLVLNDSYFPGWKAFVRPAGAAEAAEAGAPVIRVNGNFRGVQLAAGSWTVRFRYSPVSFQLGGLMSFMGVILLAFGAGIWGWNRLVNPQGELTAARSIARNSAAPMVLNLFNKGIDFVFAMFYLRVMGPADAGSFATAIATAGIFEILSNFGLDILVIRDVSRDRSQASSYLLNTTILRLGAALVASLPMLALVAGTGLFSNPFTRPEILAIGFIMIGMLFSGMSKGVTGLFYVHEQAEVPAAMTTATTMLKVGFGVVALLLGTSFVGLAAVSILSNLITLALLGWMAQRRFALAGPWQVDWRLQRRMVRLGYPLMLIHLLQTVFISVDIYLLRLMLANGEQVVGWYSSAYKWFNALQIIPSFFTLALFPIISREIERSVTAARQMYRMALKLMLLLALPVAAMTTFLAYPLVEILGGPEFLPHGAIALQIVIWSVPVGWLNSVTNYVLIALGLEQKQPRAFALAVGFNLGANLLLIPRYSYVAASVTTILSEVVLLLVFDYYLRQRMPALEWGRLLPRPLLVTGVTLGLMWLGSQVHLALAVAVGVVAYPLGLWALGVVGPAELAILRAVLPGALRARLARE